MTKNKDQNNQNVFFTIIPTRVSGFTDKLNQFSALYRLGRNMGYNYYHTDFKSPRSSNYSEFNSDDSFLEFGKKIIRKMSSKFTNKINSDVFYSIGFNQFMKEKNKNLNLSNFAKIDINLEKDLIINEKIDSLECLENFIKETLSNCRNPNKLIVLRMKQSGRSLLKFIFSDIPLLHDQLNLREKYFELRKNFESVSKFDDKKLKILVHIRQGDTAVIKTPWNTYISVYALYEMIEDEFVELNSLDELKSHKHIDINVFKKFIQKLLEVCGEKNISLLIFSDGFKRAFAKVEYNKDKLNLTKRQIKLLMKSSKEYDYDYFKALNNIDAKRVIGESKQKLFALICSIFDSDIIVIGNQQAMIPKLLSFYFNINNMPFVIVLYKNTIPYYPFLTKDIIDKKFIFVDIEKSDYREIILGLNSKIEIKQ